jgi:hypothetical protein
MNTVVLFFHQGWTDIINCLSLINYHCELYSSVTLLIRKDSNELINFYTKKMRNLNIKYLDKHDLDMYNFTVNSNGIKFIGCHDIFRDDKFNNAFSRNSNYPECFYINYNIPYSVRITHFNVERDYEKESELYKKFVKKHGLNYTLCHGNLIVNNKNTNVKSIYLDECSNTFFDMIKVLENAGELHLIDSVWGSFVYHLDAKYGLFKNIKVFLYLRSMHHIDMFTKPVTLDNWIMIKQFKH